MELSGGQRVHAFHKSSQCAPDHCPVHNPSDHAFRDLPLFYEGVGQYMYRVNEDGTQILDPDDYKLRTHGCVIVRNSGTCLVCATNVVSTYRHGMVACDCANVTIDGGTVYLKRSVGNIDAFKETSIICTPDNLVIQ